MLIYANIQIPRRLSEEKKISYNLIQNVFFIIKLSRSYSGNYFLEVCNIQGYKVRLEAWNSNFNEFKNHFSLNIF